MSSIWGNNIKISIFGESHGKAIGVTIDGLPSGEAIDLEELLFQMERRAPGRDKVSTLRRESDAPKILSGLYKEKTTGTPLTAIIENSDTRSGDYENLNILPRPSHADYTGHIRYKGFADNRGGGHFSGRLTAPLVFAGAICRQILKRRGITIGSHIYSIGNITDTPFDPVNIDETKLEELVQMTLPVNNKEKELEMRSTIENIRPQGDSLGGIVECAATGLPPGIGSPIFGGVENIISSLIFGIPAVKGIEFGAGFSSAIMTGSQCNDDFTFENGKIKTISNNSGGIQGGITNGMPLILRVAFKPTPSISKEQNTVNLATQKNEKLTIRGRHDPCIVPRALPVVESAVAISLCSLMKEVNAL